MTLTLKIVNQVWQKQQQQQPKNKNKKWLSGPGDTERTRSDTTEKISSGQTFTDILNLRCDLDLERSNPIFPTGHYGL